MNEIVRQFYQNNPYPAISRFAKVQIPSKYFENFCVQLKKKIPEQPEILIVGCGTVAPAAIATRYPDAKLICALDISENTIEIAKANVAKKLQEKIVWVNADLESETLIDNLPVPKFDWIHCTGVLHHLASPAKGISNLSRLLKDDSLMRFQVYSKGSRLWIEWLRQFLITQNVLNSSDVKEILCKLPAFHPFRYVLATYPESIKDSGLKDGFLHPQVNSYYFNEWQQLLKNNNLQISILENLYYLDDLKEIFPESLMKSINNLTILKKVQLLEKLGEWRSDFKGIITKSKGNNEFKDLPINLESQPIHKNQSYPRTYLWQQAKIALKELNEEISEQDLIKILSSLSPRCWLPFPSGMIMRFKWSAWDDLSRQLASSNIIFQENINSLLADYKENDSYVSIPSPEDWPWQQWENGFQHWKW